ncbi:MAG: hypothetical protein RL758_190 [Pseudomonadota bacterium]|jgi:hypothetical protein
MSYQQYLDAGLSRAWGRPAINADLLEELRAIKARLYALENPIKQGSPFIEEREDGSLYYKQQNYVSAGKAIPLEALQAVIDQISLYLAENEDAARHAAAGSFSSGLSIGAAGAQADALRLLKDLIKSHED